MVRPGLIPALHCGLDVNVTPGAGEKVRPGLIPALHCGLAVSSIPLMSFLCSAGINPGPPLRPSGWHG